MFSSDNQASKFSWPKIAQPLHWLVYRRVGDVVVFSSADLAVHLDAIYRALNEARTWGEFREALPPGEWEEIEHRLFLAEDEVEEEDRSRWEDDDAPFERYRVSGVDDSDYPLVDPEWLGDVEELPNALIKAHAKILLALAPRFIHWHMSSECADPAAGMLRHWGYAVEEADYLEFE
jgi:hypothetical protein